MPDDKPFIPLADAITQLRAELIEAQRRGAGQALQFRLKPIELNFEVAITKSLEGDGGVKFWVIDASAKGSYENAVTHTIKLTLEPAGDTLVNGTGEF